MSKQKVKEEFNEAFKTIKTLKNRLDKLNDNFKKGEVVSIREEKIMASRTHRILRDIHHDINFVLSDS